MILVCKSLKRASFEFLGWLPLGVAGKGPCQVVGGGKGRFGGDKGESKRPKSPPRAIIKASAFKKTL